MAKPSLVKVTWRDTCGDGGWKTPAEAMKWAKQKYATEYNTVGYLLGKTKDFICVAGSVDPDGTYNDHSMIPRSTVIRIEKVGKSK